MATGGGEEDISGSFVTCHICLEEYKDPRVLPCHHTFCLRCLQLHVTSNGSQDDTFSCPVCRRKTLTPKEGLQQLPHNLFMAEVQSTKADFKSCDLCGDDSSTYHCQECHQYICDCCKDFHDLNEGHTLKVEKEGLIPDAALEDQDNSTPFSEKLTAIVSQFSQSLLILKKELRTSEEEKMKYMSHRKEIHQRVKQQAHQIKVITDNRCEKLIKETDDFLKEKLSQLAQYTNTVSSQHRLAEEMHKEAINLQHSKNVESDQVKLLRKKLSEMQDSNADPRLRDPLIVLYHDSSLEDVRAKMGTTERHYGVKSNKTNGEPPAKTNWLIIDKWGSNWTKRRAEKVSEVQLEHCKTSTDCSYTSIAQYSTGYIFALDSEHDLIELYATKGEFLKHFDQKWNASIKFSKLAIMDTRLLVSYSESSIMFVAEVSLPEFGHKILNLFDTFHPRTILIASCGNVAVVLGKIHESKRERKRDYTQGSGRWTDVDVEYKYLEIHFFEGNCFSHKFSLHPDKFTWMQDKAPSDMAVDKEKNVFLLFPDHHCLLGLNSKGEKKFTYGKVNIPGTGVGQLTDPSCICTDNNGDIYIGDTGRIVKIKSDGAFIYHITGVCQPMSGYVFLVDHQGHIVTVEDGKVIKYIY
ncbi:uncharacterized protein LOC106152415 [Lingula anatina]|uniref:Uncharacterized protein LOC106152415 n=1 Tax=Lingula anatina TaxID=7574 RepID=A0A1S3H600_LINAN|nr:uncharacterized protein LOC106152415 [Lingula anatina]|eukprot:XP_013381428.1 uncharacterized protein LOC106152415 [Lingula anatina]